MSRFPARPDYGLDAPRTVYTLGWCGIGALSLGMLTPWVTGVPIETRRAALGPLMALGIVALATALLMAAGSRIGKLHARDRVLDALHLRGDETVVDIGTAASRGLMLIGAAKRLTSGGKAIGVDAFGSARAAIERNAQIEDAAERLELRDGSAMRLPLGDRSVDLVVSAFALNSLGDDARQQAIGEIARVLKPRGRAVLLDVAYTSDYVRALEAKKFATVMRTGPKAWTLPPMRVVIARR